MYHYLKALTFASHPYAIPDSLGLRLSVDVLSEPSGLCNKVWIQDSNGLFIHYLHDVRLGRSIENKARARPKEFTKAGAGIVVLLILT